MKRPVSSFTTMPSPFVAAHATACSTRELGTSPLGLVWEDGDGIPAVAVLGVAGRTEKPSTQEKQHARSSNKAGEALLMPPPPESFHRRVTLPYGGSCTGGWSNQLLAGRGTLGVLCCCRCLLFFQ